MLTALWNHPFTWRMQMKEICVPGNGITGLQWSILKQKFSQRGGTQPNPQFPCTENKCLEFCPKMILSCLPEKNV